MRQRVGATSKRLFLLPVVLTCSIALLAANQEDLARELGNSLRGFGVASLVAASLLVLAQVGLQSLRFWAVAPPDARLTVVEAARIFTLGDWANIFAPARGGEVLKVVLLKRADHRINLPRASGIVLADRIVDAASLLLLCVITGALGVALAASAPSISPVFAVSAAGIAALLLATAVFRRRARAAMSTDLWRQVRAGLSALTHPARGLISLSLGTLAWIAEVLAVRALCAGLGFAPSPPRLVLAILLLNIGITVPITFASLGVYEAALAYGLSQSGLPFPSAIAVAAAHHFLELLGLGLWATAFSLPIDVLRRGTRNFAPGGHDESQAPLPCGPQPGLPKSAG